MNNVTSDIILHNYPQSPVAEKIRVVLGMKNLQWRSVEIPRLPPKPQLTQLTGGYRRTPVMQIGADIYCDSLCIIRELEHRFPKPPLYPETNAGLMWCLGRWADGEFFKKSIQIILGSAGDALDPEFAKDRGRLYFGPDWAEELKQAGSTLPHLVAQMRASFTWLDNQLADGRNFMMGDTPAAIDAQLYHVVWFLRGRWKQGGTFLSEFPALNRWESKVLEIGHGNSTELTSEAAIEIASKTEPVSKSGIDENEPQTLELGALVEINPDVDGGEQPVEGKLVFADDQCVTIARQDPNVGDIQVHFPRAGYEISFK